MSDNTGVVGWERGRGRKKGISNGHKGLKEEEMKSNDGCSHCLDNGNSFTGKTYIKTHQIVYFKYVQFNEVV